MPKFVKGMAKHPGSGRKAGTRNRETVAREQLKGSPDALAHLIAVMTSTSAVVTPDLKLRAAIALAQYQHPKPWASRMTGKPIDLPPPKSAQEARDMIASLVSRMAREEIDRDMGSDLIAGLRAFLDARAAELEALYYADKAQNMDGGR